MRSPNLLSAANVSVCQSPSSLCCFPGHQHMPAATCISPEACLHPKASYTQSQTARQNWVWPSQWSQPQPSICLQCQRWRERRDWPPNATMTSYYFFLIPEGSVVGQSKPSWQLNSRLSNNHANISAAKTRWLDLDPVNATPYSLSV